MKNEKWKTKKQKTKMEKRKRETKNENEKREIGKQKIVKVYEKRKIRKTKMKNGTKWNKKWERERARKMKKKTEIETKNIPSSSVVRILQKCRSRVGEREKRESWGRERKNSSPILCSISWPDSSSFSPIALADVDGHVASDEFLRHPRQRMWPAGSGFGQFERWEWIWTLLKRSRCTVSFPLLNLTRVQILDALSAYLFVGLPNPIY